MQAFLLWKRDHPAQGKAGTSINQNGGGGKVLRVELLGNAASFAKGDEEGEGGVFLEAAAARQREETAK